MWLKANDSVLVYVIYHKSSVKGGEPSANGVSHWWQIFVSNGSGIQFDHLFETCFLYLF